MRGDRHLKTYIDALVVYAPVCDLGIEPIHPHSRYVEITECKSDKARREKYCVWKLLEKVVSSELNCDFANLRFTKTKNGQWVCPDFYFSLSHTDGLVCVAISHSPIGVDAEKVRPIRHELKHKVLTEREIGYMASLAPAEQGEYLLCSWVKKESIFKKTGGAALLPNRTEADGHITATHRVKLGDGEYLISACTDTNEKIQFRYMEEI